MLCSTQSGFALKQVDARFPPLGVPEFRVLIATGTSVPGISAIFIALFENGPLIPGPLIKNPNASLKLEQVYPGYSLDAKTYLNMSESPFGTKSNSKIAALLMF